MEEEKKFKNNRVVKLISKILSYFLFIVVIFIGVFLAFYVISGKIAQKKGENPMFGLFTIISPSMTPNINVYDVVFTKKADTSTLKKGDIITFYSTNSYFGGTPITHRIVEVLNDPDEGLKFMTKGDANQSVDKEKVYAANVLGKVAFRIPQLGRIQFFLASKGGWIIAIMIPALAIIAYDIYKIMRLVFLKNKMLALQNKHGNI